ncbi:MAG: hypothetical protein ABI779_10095, partial [Acidobacteriota bacterium]
MQGTVFLHSGELQVSAVDLDAGGRAGWNVIISRVYRSRTIGLSPIGMGWDASIFKHLRALPNGNVEYHDGAGEIRHFKPQSSSAGYLGPKGLFLRLARSERGWTLIDQKMRITQFDELGRLVSEADAFSIPWNYTAGNTILYLNGPDGQLQQIVDPVGRVTRITYYANDDTSPGAAGGLLKEVTDWRGRSVTYLYDNQHRLTEVRLPAVANATSGAGRPTIRYGYHAGAVSFNDMVELGPNLVSITDPNEAATAGPPRVTYSYFLTGPNRDRIEKETWPTGETVTFNYVSPTQVEVKDALGQVRSYTINGTGIDAQIAAIVERQIPTSTTPLGTLPTITATGIDTALQDRTWSYEYSAEEGLLTKLILAGVRETVQTYQAAPPAPGRVLASTTTSPVTPPATSSLRAVSTTSAPAGAITRAFTYQNADPTCTNACAPFLQSVAANGLAIEMPEAHRGKLEPLATNDDIEAKTKFDAQGRPIAVTSTGGTDTAAAGSAAAITYRPDTGPLHARGEIAENNRGGEITKFDYPSPDQTVILEPRGITRTIDFDSWRRPSHVSVAGPALTFDERFIYDATGRLVR